jgi:hypothetical protein
MVNERGRQAIPRFVASTLWISGVESLQDGPSTSSPRSIGGNKLACAVNLLMRSFISDEIAGEGDGLNARYCRALRRLVHHAGH